MLVPWAKCVLWCRDHRAQIIAPFWTKPRIGPFLRFERDKRQYQRFFIPGDQVSGFDRLLLLARSRKVDVKDWRPRTLDGKSRPVVVRFRDMDGTEALVSRHSEIAAELFRITKPEFLPRSELREAFIGVHVRLSDFQRASRAELEGGIHCRRIPVEWYADAVLALQRELGNELPARVFSDGSDDELKPLLALDRISRAEKAPAITDMLALSQSSVLVASGSAFSMWGCYLGGAPAIWFPGQQFSIRGRTAQNSLDIEWDSGEVMPESFVARVRERIGNR